METEKRRGRVYGYSCRSGQSDQKRGSSAPKTTMEIDPGVHHLWLSNGNETRVLRAYIETSKRTRIQRSDKARLLAGAFRHRRERQVRTELREARVEHRSQF